MRSKFFLILLGVLVLIFAWNVIGFMNKSRETTRNRKIVEDKVTELKKTKEKLDSDILKLKTEDGIEENIREKFGLAKEGEDMITIVEDKNSTGGKERDESGSFFSFFENLFK